MKNRLTTAVALWIPLAAMILFASCSDIRKGTSPRGFWDTGCRAIDSLLNRADTLDRVIDYDGDLAMEVYLDIAGRSDSGSSLAEIRSVARYASAVLAEFNDEDSSETVMRDIAGALSEAQKGEAPYLRHRMELELAIRDTDVKKRTEALYSLLPYFTALGDSMRVTDILYELNNSYGDIWDPATQTDCFREIIRWTPQFVAPLRDLMQYNILAVERGTAPAGEYLHGLDSMASLRPLLDASAPLGVIVYADRYRLRGDSADLDTASMYAERLTAWHDALKTYWSQQLSHALSTGNRAKALKFASLIEDSSGEPTPMEIETLPVLLRYYRSLGDSAAARRVNTLYQELKLQATAHEESNALASMRADRRISEITSDISRRSDRWSRIAVLSLIIVAVALLVLIMLMRRHRKEKRKSGNLESQLLNTQRRLSVAELKQQEGSDTIAPSWESFEAVFLEMHPGFSDSLRRDFPALTRNDIQLCALIRMEMDTKHIAAILSIQPDSVKKRFQRLRSKLNLAPGAPISPFLSRY